MTPHPSTLKAARAIATAHDLDQEAYTDNLTALIEAHCHVSEMVEALQLAQKWLVNCVPVAMLEGPHPLPVIADILAKVTK